MVMEDADSVEVIESVGGRRHMANVDTWMMVDADGVEITSSVRGRRHTADRRCVVCQK